MKNHDAYDWLSGIDKRNLLMKSLGSEGREKIKHMSKNEIENIDLNLFLPSPENIFRAIGKILNPS